MATLRGAFCILKKQLTISTAPQYYFIFLFLVNKYEKEKLQRLLQDQLLKDQAFRTTIEEKIQTIENINDVIDYINKSYRLGIPIAKEIVDEIRK